MTRRKRPKKPAVERLWAKIDRKGNDECWPWNGAINSEGYGCFFDGAKTVAPHRFLFIEKHGSIPEGLHVHHLCGVRNCCNVNHMMLLSASDHSRITPHPGKTHCVNGHALVGDNLLVFRYKTKKGGFTTHRKCRICTKAAQHRYQVRNYPNRQSGVRKQLNVKYIG